MTEKKREPLSVKELEDVVEAFVLKDWRAAAWLIARREAEAEPVDGRDGVDELAKKRAKRRAS